MLSQADKDWICNYISERVKESQRLFKWARNNGHKALAQSHFYSSIVGQKIIDKLNEGKDNEHTSS